MTDAAEVAEVVQGEVVEETSLILATKTSIETLIENGPAALPATLEGTLVLADWYKSLAYGVPYVEADPNAIMRKILLQTANAETADQLFERTAAQGLQGIVPNRPGAGTGPVIIHGLSVAKTNLDGGVPCFMVLEITSKKTGETVITTTGAQEMQMQILGFLAFGIWPIECNIRRMDVKDKGGRFMFRLYPIE